MSSATDGTAAASERSLRLARAGRAVTGLPPASYFLTSAVFHYLGPSFAVLLFAHVSVLGVAWLRIAAAAAVFALWRRPWRLLRAMTVSQRWVLLELGAVLAAMNSLFYLAIDRLPLATVGAVEFLGTVVLAAAGARTRRNLLALALAIGGVLALTAVRLAGEPLGFIFAFANCAGFMLYVTLGHKIANISADGTRPARGSMSGIDQLGAAMLVAAAVAIPAGLPGAIPAFTHPAWLAWGIGVGACSSVIPYVTDQLAMARLPRATFALMLALLPAAATAIGLIILGQVPTLQDLLGIGLVIAGVALHHNPARPDPPPASAVSGRRRQLRPGCDSRQDSPNASPQSHSSDNAAELRAARTRRGAGMQYLRLGRSGLKVSRLGLGMMSYGDPSGQPWALAEDEAEPIVRRAVEAGITFFDTADMYSDGASEQITGRLLRNLFPRRDDYVLATKVYYPTGQGPNDRGLSRKHILASIDASLRRLGTDHVDLYQIHRWDDETPVEETMATLHDVVRAGKARYIGASTMRAWQFAKAQHTARAAGWTAFASMQNRYNLLNREDEREMIPLCLDQGVGIIPYSPLARGLLAGTRERSGERHTLRSGTDDLLRSRAEDFDVIDTVRAIATQRSLPPAQIALAWLLGKPGISAPIIGATQARHLDEAVPALEVTLTGDETARLEAQYLPHFDGEYT